MKRQMFRTTAASLAAAALVLSGCESMSERQEGTAVGAGVKPAQSLRHAAITWSSPSR